MFDFVTKGRKKQSKLQKKIDKISCAACGDIKKISEFYMSYNPIHETGRIPYCKLCLKKMIADEKGNVKLEKLKETLRLIDRPFLYDIWKISLEKSKNGFGSYMKNLAMPQYRNLGWIDSKMLPDIDNELNYDEVNEENGFELTDDVISFFGKINGYTEDDYEYLTNRYSEYINSYQSDSPAMEELLKQAAFESLEIQRKRSKGADASKNLKNLQEILGSANIKPNQETGANAVDQISFGLLIKKWENEEPIPEPDEEWKDVDGIGKYIRIWFLGHLCKMLGITNEYSKEYEDEMDRLRVELPFDNTSIDELNGDDNEEIFMASR